MAANHRTTALQHHDRNVMVWSLSRFLPLAVALVLAPLPALAADAVFPPGVRVGLVPLPGLAAAKTFPGFESADRDVKVIMTELPAEAFGEVETAVKAGNVPGPVKPQGIETAVGTAYFTSETAQADGAAVRRYSMILRGDRFSGYVAMQVPDAATDFSEAAVKAMFATAALRKDVPLDEQLGLLPFRLKDLADFRHVRSLAPGAVIMLADDDGSSGIETSPFMVIGLIPAKLASADDRGRLAQQAARTIPGLREARITMSEPIRIDGAPGFETRIDAVSGKNDTPVTVVQWLRFGAGDTALRVIGSASREAWPGAFPRFRAVRDGIAPR
jgi:hypothetical protein